MLSRIRRAALPLLCIMAAAMPGAAQEAYPSKPVRLVVGYAAGGGVDTLARLLAQTLSARLGQQVVVDNRAGAGGTLAADHVANAPPDGYTLYFAETGILIAPAIYPKVTYDPVKSFAPVARVGQVHLALVAGAAVPASDPAGLVALLKSRPGTLFYGTPGVGTVQHLAGELFKKTAGVDMEHVAFKGAAPAITAMLGGEVQLGVVSLPPALTQAQAGKLKIIGVTSASRAPSAPGVPTLSETLPGFDATPSVFVLAPAGTPAPVVGRLDEAIRTALADKDLQAAFERQGGTVSPPGTPEAFGRELADEVRKWGVIARESGAKAE